MLLLESKLRFLKNRHFRLIMFFTISIFQSLLIFARELDVDYELGVKLFHYDKPQFPEQFTNSFQSEVNSKVSFRGNVSKDWASKGELYFNYDSAGETTWDADIREFVFEKQLINSDVQLGLIKEFWGRLEANNVVDVINAKNTKVDYRGKTKVAQLGIKYTHFLDESQLDSYILPYAETEEFAEGRDRYRRTSFNYRDEQFEKNRYLPSLALRYSKYLDNGSYSLSNYYGYSRQASFLLDENTLSDNEITPYYELYNQTSLDADYVYLGTIYKAEIAFQERDFDDFYSLGLGIENEFNTIFDTKYSLTTYLEFYHDTRKENESLDIFRPNTAFNNDWYMGVMFNFNDISNSQILMDLQADYKESAYLFHAEYSRKLNDNTDASLLIDIPFNEESDPALAGFSQDERVFLNFNFYF